MISFLKYLSSTYGILDENGLNWPKFKLDASLRFSKINNTLASYLRRYSSLIELSRDAVLSVISNYPNLESYPNPSENYPNPKFYHLLIGLEVLSFLLYIHN